MEEKERLEGTVEAVTFRNEQNGYTVLRLNEGGELITVVGNLPSVHEGDILRLEGVWETHRLYGRQLHALQCEQVRPATAEAILKYLSSGVIKGVGPSTACRLVETFGEQTLDVIEKEPERLAQIKGISLSYGYGFIFRCFAFEYINIVLYQFNGIYFISFLSKIM